MRLFGEGRNGPAWVLPLVLIAFAFLASAPPALAQAPAQAEARQMNSELSAANDRAAVLAVLQRRQALLIELLRTAPTTVDDLLLSPQETQRILALAPEGAALLESRGAFEGELEEEVLDSFDAGTTKTFFYLRMSAGERIEILNDPGFPARPENYFCAIPIRVSGLKVGSVLRASSAEAVPFKPAVACSPVGQQQLAVILLNYSTVPLNAAWTFSSANSMAFGASSSIAAYIGEVSHSKASVGGQVFGPYTIDTLSGCPGTDAVTQAALGVIGNSIDLTVYHRLLFIIPAHTCTGGTVGLSTVGCVPVPLPGAPSNMASRAWVNAASPFSQSGRLSTVHEFGHSLGVRHAVSLHFPGRALGDLNEAPLFDEVADEYGDGFSVMGNISIGHLSAPHQDYLQWLDPEAVTTVVNSGPYTVRPIESALGQNPKTLKIQRPGTTRYLWVEYRQPTGLDATLSTWSSTAFQGIIVHYQPPPGTTIDGRSFDLRNTGLLDFHPLSSDVFTDSPLLTGESWADPYSGLTLTIGAATAAGIGVTVNLGSTCFYALSPGSGTTVPAAGGSGSITVTTATGCAWTATSNSGWLTITSGSSGSGPGTVQFLAAANAGSARAGIIGIGSGVAIQNYTVSQGGTGGSSNDEPSGATLISALPFTGTQNTIPATSSVTDPEHSCTGSSDSNTVWFRYVAGFNGFLRVDTFGSDYDTVLTAYPGTTTPGAELTCTDDSDSLQSEIMFTVTSGQSYLIEVSQWDEPAGGILLLNVAVGTGCTYSLSPTSQPFGSAGGSGNVLVTTTSSCTWTGVSNAVWITAVNGSNRTGTGSLSYNVAANSGALRAGTLTIAGQTFTVTQSAGTVGLTPDNALTLSQFVGGGPEWNTTLFITNLSSVTEGFTLRFYDDFGLPKAMPIDTLGMVNTIAGSLAPGQTLRYVTGAAPILHVAWALMTPATPGTERLSGLAIFKQTVPSGMSTVSSEAVVDFTGVKDSKYVLQYDNVGGFTTTAMFANPDVASPLTILADIRDAAGVLLATDSITLPALGHTAFVLTDRFPATINRRGSIRLAASPRGFTGLGIRFSAVQTFTSLRFLLSRDMQ